MTTKHSQAYRRIKVLLEAGHFEAGERVTEAKVAKMVGMSRGPVRESLLRLQAEGLLHHKANWRSRVMAYTEDQDPRDMLRRYELREAIESNAVRLAAQNMTDAQIRRLQRLFRQIEDAWESDDRQARHDAAAEFHQFLMANCGNPLFLAVWQKCCLAPTLPRSPQLEDAITASAPEGDRHGRLREIVEAIAARDPDRAETMMKQSVRGVTEAIRKTLGQMDAKRP